VGAQIPAAAAATLDAMRAGADVVYQGVFFDGAWLGYADFLRRVEMPSALGTWSYEVEDAKLARRAKPYFLLQLCAYSEQLGRVQGAAPERMHVVLGTGRRESFRRVEYDAYYRRVKARLVEHVAAGAPETYPEPVEHCAMCRWAPHCDARRLADDHPSLVAGIRREQTARLADVGVTTLAALARLDPEADPAPLPRHTLRNLTLQARLQRHHAEHGEHRLRAARPRGGQGLRAAAAALGRATSSSISKATR
jgi:predicted RecB family nuclease